MTFARRFRSYYYNYPETRDPCREPGPLWLNQVRGVWCVVYRKPLLLFYRTYPTCGTAR